MADAVIDELVADLDAEHAALDHVVAELHPDQWHEPTPSPGWTVQDQIGHLSFFDAAAAQAMTDTDAFAAAAGVMAERLSDAGGDMTSVTLGEFRSMSGAEVLVAWRAARRTMLDAAATVDATKRLPWYGPSMGVRSFLTARLMETWAHGQDVVDTVGGDRPATDRLRHVAELGVRTRAWSFRNRGLAVPDREVRVELVLPSGAAWTRGAPASADRIAGPAEDFCLVVTQRRHVSETALVVEGEAAREWTEVAQAFAGPPTTRRRHGLG